MSDLKENVDSRCYFNVSEDALYQILRLHLVTSGILCRKMQGYSTLSTPGHG